MITSVFEYIENNKEKLIEEFQSLLRIPSEQSEAKGNLPFGENVDAAYEYMLSKAKSDGFKVFDADRYGGHIDYAGKGSEVMGIVGHLDVVPAGSDWDYDPYGAEIHDGYIYARGTTDNKGPMAACYFAMKALKECGFEPEKTIRMILGLDEENDWVGMNYYLDHADAPDFGFTPDADFPAIHGEKGILIFDVAGKFSKAPNEGLRLRSVKGGNAANMVPDSARAVVLSDNKDDYESIKGFAAQFRSERGYKINTKQIGKSFEITVQGVSAHGAKPEDGLNAISILMEFLGLFNFINDDMNGFIDFYNSCIGFELDGSSFGIGLSDEPSGKLVLNAGVIDMTDKGVTLTINVRYPVTAKAEEVYEGIAPSLEKYNLGVIKGKSELPIYLPLDHPLIETLMSVYRKHSRDTESKPLIIGGGTYARAFDNVVAFGAMMPGEEDLMHQKNERISIDKMVMITKLYAEAIYELTK